MRFSESDLDEYREAMVRDGRCLLRITPG